MTRRKPKDDQGLEEAIGKAGGPQVLARLIGVSPAAISVWKRVPVNRVFDVERVTGVSRHVLRPDFWPEGDAA